ncbi:hypothetical protein [Streptomyces sp. Isolate_45]|uniref:hypothetical protein n=1 Tax=Streptomyces sp. Isolate_45 TaxID=2950111 RepID=UPI002481CC11|nr:hypothetical protein [Streptomyces sp. Isolate_45]MDA5284737.1 hypothetical protein [Streptomyces sp. Isolate_45]
MMTVESGDSKREFVGYIRIANQPKIELRVMATSTHEARSLVTEQYGEGHVIVMWNEEDASRPSRPR